MNQQQMLDLHREATAWARGGSKAAAFALQAISLLPAVEPFEDMNAFDFEYGTEGLPDPAHALHRSARAYLQGLGDLLCAQTEAFQEDRPLLVSTGTIARSIVEYSVRAIFVTDVDALFVDRIGRSAELLNDGFNQTGGRNPKTAKSKIEVSNAFYQWYTATQPRLVKDLGHHSVRLNAGNNAHHCRILGDIFQDKMYSHLSDLAHGNGAAVLALHDATLPQSYKGQMWTQANSIGCALYALKCALRAGQCSTKYLATADKKRTIAQILPYVSDVSEMSNRTPTELLAIMQTENTLAEEYLDSLYKMLQET